jgi:FkbM family methyltransferase
MVQRGNVVYDLGANVGYYSLLASVLVGPDGQVFSFEPVPRNLGFLRRHIELNRVKNCSVFDVAVSNSNGTAKFDFGSHFHLGHLGGESENTVSVRTVTLDSLVTSGEIKPPNVIKCDIEGAEFNALTGARGTLSKYSPVIFLATHGPKVHQDCCVLLTDLGYQLTPLDAPSLTGATEVLAVRPAISDIPNVAQGFSS